MNQDLCPSRLALMAGICLLSVVLVGLPATAQEHQGAEQATENEAEGASHEEHGEEDAHHGHAYHPNEIAFFAGITDEEGHDSEFSLGLE